MVTQRDLLFAVLAFQNGLIEHGQLVEACAATRADDETSLAGLLEARGWLTASDRGHIEYLLERALARHGGDAGASLAALATASVPPLEAAQAPPTVAEAPPGERPSFADLLDALAPFDRYARLRLHARGGIGQVWLVRDAHLDREVALKELRPETAGDSVARARFVGEARITGQLEHPGVVPVYELLPGPDGAPSYAMRFIRGRTLSEAVHAFHRSRAAGQAEPVELQGLLNAFVAVCNTVAYAHARGVIHRDLKGPNVVLGDYGEVMVLDWGLAKLVGAPDSPADLAPVAVRSGEAPDQTLAGQIVGTPAYMAPEQAEGRLERIDSRTDVYGLGALLYEILTDRPPFAGADLHTVLRQVVQEAPVPPRQVWAGVSRPLEAICLRALAKDPAQRCASARDLGREVQRYLADEPVESYREPLGARLARSARRHKALVTGVAGLLVAAVIALAVSNVVVGREKRRTEQARQRALTYFRQARDAVDRFHTQVSESRLLNEPGMQPLRAELLKNAEEFYRRMAEEQKDDPELRADLAQALMRRAEITSDLGRPTEAAALIQEAIARFAELSRDWPNIADHRRDRARCWNKLGTFYHHARDFDRAEAPYLAARELFARLVDEAPGQAGYRRSLAVVESNLGVLYNVTGRPDRARRAHASALKIRQQLLGEDPGNTAYQRDLADTIGNLAALEAESGDLKTALVHFEKALPIRQTLAGAGGIEDRNDLAEAYKSLARTYLFLDRPHDAEQRYEKARDLQQRVAAANPAMTRYRNNLAGIQRGLGEFYYATRGEVRGPARCTATARALEAYNASLRLMEELVREHPGVQAFRTGLGLTCADLGNLLYDDNKQESLPWYDRAIAELQRVEGKGGKDAVVCKGLRTSYWGRAGALSAAGRHDEALADWQRALRCGGASSGLRADAAEAAEAALGKGAVSGARYYRLAVVYSLIAAETGQQNALHPEADRSARRAVELLNKARATGYFDRERRQQLRQDSDLDPLRSRADFQKLLRQAAVDR